MTQHTVKVFVQPSYATHNHCPLCRTWYWKHACPRRPDGVALCPRCRNPRKPIRTGRRHVTRKHEEAWRL